MANKNRMPAAFTASFSYTNEILADFEALYLQKKHVSPRARVLCAVIGVVGVVYFGYTLYTEGFSIACTGYLIACSLLVLVACSGGRKNRKDETIQKYRKYYTNRQVQFRIDEDGIEMKLEGQKNYARSKFKEIYGLYETDKCFYFVIKGKAYYILSKAALKGGSVDELRTYMQRHCRKSVLYYTDFMYF